MNLWDRFKEIVRQYSLGSRSSPSRGAESSGGAAQSGGARGGNSGGAGNVPGGSASHSSGGGHAIRDTSSNHVSHRAGSTTVSDSGSHVSGATGFSENEGDQDAYVPKNEKKSGRGNGNQAQTPTQPDPIPPDVSDVQEDPVVIHRSEDDSLTEAEEQQIDYLLSVEEDPLAREMLIKIKNEGIPEDIAFADYMKQFAQWGWDDLSDEHAKAIMEIVMQDRANDQIESLVVFDEETGFVILDRIGIEVTEDFQYVGLQIEEIEMMRGRDVIFVHNHPKGVRASDEDLATAWIAGAKSVIIVTPEGFEYVYSRGNNGMVFEGKNELEFEVAPATVEEYNELRALSRQQAWTLLSNRPEYLMYQDREDFIQVVFDGNAEILLPQSKDLPDQVIDFILYVWSQNDSISFDQWSRLINNETGRQRSQTYEIWADILRQLSYRESFNGQSSLSPVQSDITFYDATHGVTRLLALGESSFFDFVNYQAYSIRGEYDQTTFDSAKLLLDVIGIELMDLNSEIFSELVTDALNGKNVLTSEYLEYLAIENNLSIDPSMLEVESAITWDVHMVWREQQLVEDTLESYDFVNSSRSEIDFITEQVNIRDGQNLHPYVLSQALDSVIVRPVSSLFIERAGQAGQAVYWAENAVDANIEFARLDHRRAIGIAMIFQNHGRSEDEFVEYFRNMTIEDEVFGVIPQPVENVLNLD